MDIKQTFLWEAEELLATISEDLLDLEANPQDKELLNQVFRAAHTLKGSANLFGLSGVSQLTHALESVLDRLRSEELELEAGLTDLLLRGFDQLVRLIKAIARGQEDPQPIPELVEKLQELSSGRDRTHEILTSGILPAVDEEYLCRLKGTDWAEICYHYARGNKLWQIVFEPAANLFFSGHDLILYARSLAALGRLAAHGFYLPELPAWETFEPLSCYLRWQIILATGQEVTRDQLAAEVEFLAGEETEVKLAEFTPALLDWEIDGHLGEDVTFAVETQTAEFLGAIGEELVALEQERNWSPSLPEAVRKIRADLQAIAGKQTLDPLAARALSFLVSTLALIQGYLERTGADSGELPQWWPEFIEAVGKALAVLVTGKLEMALGSLVLDIIELCSLETDLAGTQEAHAVAQEIDVDFICRIAKQQLKYLAPTGEVDPARWPLAQRILLNCARALQDAEWEAVLSGSDPDLASLSDRIAVHGGLAKARSKLSNRAEIVAAVPANPKAVLREGLFAGGIDSQVTNTVKIEQEKIDRLMDLSRELVIAKNSLPYLLRKLNQGVEEQQMAKDLKEKHALFDRLARELQTIVMEMRMLPLSHIFGKFHRFVRDYSRQSGKQIRLQVEGEGTLLDKSIVEVLAEVFVHLVRNALDHGLELPAERLAAGKDSEGLVRLRGWRAGEKVYLEISDDGRGIDVERVKSKAVEKGVLSAQAASALSREAALQLIFHPGLSTADQVTDLSGRGVGMDAVLRTVERVQGKLQVSSEPGRGTAVQIEVPLTMAMTRVLQVVVNGKSYGIPSEQVQETVRLKPKEMQSMQGKTVIVLREQIIPVIHLAQFFRMDQREATGNYAYVVILKNGVGLRVDGLMGQHEVVIKPLDRGLAHLACFAGATILGDGTVLLVINGLNIRPEGDDSHEV